MTSFKPSDVGISDATGREKFMQYIDDECNTFKGKLSQSLQSSMVETDYYSIRIKSGNWSIGSTDDSQKKQYSNKYVCTLSCKDVDDYLDSIIPSDALKEKFVSTFFLSDESPDIVGRDNFIQQNLILRYKLIGQTFGSLKMRICPTFTIDLTKLSSTITLNGNILND